MLTEVSDRSGSGKDCTGADGFLPPSDRGCNSGSTGTAVPLRDRLGEERGLGLAAGGVPTINEEGTGNIFRDSTSRCLRQSRQAPRRDWPFERLPVRRRNSDRGLS